MANSSSVFGDLGHGNTFVGSAADWAQAHYQLLTTLLIGVFMVVLSFVQRKISSKGRTLPPGPRPYPVIGNLHLFKEGVPLHHPLSELAKQYGPLLSLKFGAHLTVVATNSKYAKEILKTQNQHFASRAETSAGVIMNYNRMNVVWAPYEEHLKKVRKIIQTQLLSVKRIASFETIRKEEILGSVNSIVKECKGGTEPIIFDDKMSELSTNNITRMIFGKSFFGNSATAEAFTDKNEFMDLVRGIFRMTGVVVPGDFIPLAKPFDISGYQKTMRQLAKKADEHYNRILDEHRGRKPKNGEQDFVDILLSLPKKDAVTEVEVKGLLGDMIFAGTDTSANHNCWTLAELLRHPATLKKLQDELDSVVGRDRLVTESDLSNLPYLQAVVKESMRLHPVAALLPYESTSDTFIDGYFIPAKTRIFVNNHAISRDPATWENPLEFTPERFLDGGGDGSTRDVRGQDFEMMPFGSGRRSCSGMNLGLLMVQFTVAQLVHAVNWELPAGMKPEDISIEEDVGISIPMKHPLRVIATHRLNPSILNDAVKSA